MYMHTHVYMYMYMCRHMDAYTYAHVYLCVYIPTYVYIDVCIYMAVYKGLLRMYVYIPDVNPPFCTNQGPMGLHDSCLPGLLESTPP